MNHLIRAKILQGGESIYSVYVEIKQNRHQKECLPLDSKYWVYRVQLSLISYEDKTDTNFLTKPYSLNDCQCIHLYTCPGTRLFLPFQGLLPLPSKNLHTKNFINSRVISSRKRKKSVIFPFPKTEPPSLGTIWQNTEKPGWNTKRPGFYFWLFNLLAVRTLVSYFSSLSLRDLI